MSEKDESQLPDDRPAEPPATHIYSPHDSASQLVRVLDQYLADLQAGLAPDKARLFDEHPDLAQELEQCLAGIEFVHRAGKPATGTPTQLGDFRIIREVGRGGMGVVYEAEQISLKRKVALKVLRFGVGADAEVARRFQREAETVAHLHHTNIVPIHAVGSENGVQYYAMQFIEGKSLAAVAENRGQTLAPEAADRNPFRTVAGWILQIAEALAYSHQRGVIHRDIKPSNLILDPEGTVWLTDFGLARRADEVTMTAAGILMGTPRYMSPEQAAAATRPVDHRTDIYSLGATLYELTTGKPVFDSETPLGVITQILNTDPVAPRSIQVKLPRDLETIIVKCLAKDPANRYQHARDLADDLRSFLENRSIKARRASIVERAVRFVRKHQRSTVVASATAATSLVLMTIGFFAWTAYRESLMGRLTLQTDGPTLVADAFDHNNVLAVPSFPVPNPQPVGLSAGPCRVELSASGALSEDWLIDIGKGRQESYTVNLIDRLLGPSLELLGSEDPAFIELNGQMHLFHRVEHGWRLTRGDTLRRAWQNDLQRYPEKPAEAAFPNTGLWEAWQDILQTTNHGRINGDTGASPGIIQPAIRVNDDDKDDFVLASRVSPSLICVSGADGKVLWWYRTPPPFPEGHDAAQDPFDLKISGEEAGVIGQPVLANLDGEPIVFALMVSQKSQLKTVSGKNFTSPRMFSVVAVAARTGKQVWQVKLDLPELATTASVELAKDYFPKPEIVLLERRETLAFVANTKILGFDARTGNQACCAIELGDRPVQRPQFGDLDEDRDGDLLLVLPKRNSTTPTELILKAIALKSGSTIWEHDFRSVDRLDHRPKDVPGSELAMLFDLDGDQKPEVILSTTDEWEKTGRHWYGIEVLEGATGQRRWSRELWKSKNVHSSWGQSHGSVRFLPGPDLNGDRKPELFATSVGIDYRFDKYFLRVDALSGSDGSVIWHRGIACDSMLWLTERRNRMQWWQVDEEGWPQLLIPVGKGNRGQPVTYVVSSSSGRINHVVPEFDNPDAIDINADGILDISCVDSSQGRRRLCMIKGLPPIVWRRPGFWYPGNDYNADGMNDFIEIAPNPRGYSRFLTIHSGRDGKILWQVEVRADASPPFFSYHHMDIDRDGTSDLVMLEQAQNNHSVVSAFSGKDGRRLWADREIGLRGGLTSQSGTPSWANWSYPLIEDLDLDADGRPEILVAAPIESDNQTGLTAVSSKDGSLLWKIPILKGAYTGRSFIDRNLWGDLNADGVLDVVLWVPQSFGEQGMEVGAQLQAFSGRDGKPLWPEAAKLAQPSSLYPRTAIGDLDGDGRPEVVLTTISGKGWDADLGGISCELVVLDGRQGNRQWSWGWLSNAFNLWPPLLVNGDGDGRMTVCMAVIDQSVPGNAVDILMFDGHGNIRNRRPIGSLDGGEYWTALDLDGDTKEELVFWKDSKLIALRITDLKTMWEFPIGFQSLNPKFDDVLKGPKGAGGILPVWSGQTVFGVDLATGTGQWRCDVPKFESYQRIAMISGSGKSGELPVVVSLGTSPPNTLVQQALPTKSNGVYSSPVPKIVSASADSELFQHVPLPWCGGPRSMPSDQFYFLLMVFFGTLVWWSIRRRWRRVILYLVLDGVLAILMGSLFLLTTDSPLEPGERYSWDGWHWILLISSDILGGLTALAWIVVFALKLISRWIWGTTRNTGHMEG